MRVACIHNLTRNDYLHISGANLVLERYPWSIPYLLARCRHGGSMIGFHAGFRRHCCIGIEAVEVE